jgi:hypothetical protein
LDSRPDESAASNKYWVTGFLLLSQDTLELCEKFGKTVMWNFAPARDFDKSYLAKEALFLINNRKPIK